MSSFAHIPLDKIHKHPANVRFTAAADEEMVDSIRAQGIVTPITVAPHPTLPDEYVLIAGHRRHHGATMAEVATLPAYVREDLVTEAQQIEAMVVENFHREDLTAVEEAAAYEQLSLFGMTPQDIAAATGRSTATVKARMKLTRLPESSRTKLHDGQMTIGDAESLLEFADDPEQLAELEAAAGTGNFRWHVERARGDRDRRARQLQMIAEFEGEGAKKAEFTGWDHENGPVVLSMTKVDPAAHAKAGCLGWIPARATWLDPELVCTTPSNHPAAAEQPTDTRGGRDAEWERQRAERERKQAEARAAAKVRIDHMMRHFIGLLTAKQLGKPMLAALRVTVPAVLEAADFDVDAYVIAAGLTTDGPVSWWSIQHDHVTSVRSQSQASFLKTYAAMLTAQVEGLLSFPDATDCVGAWEWLESTGYTLSDADKELRDEAIAEQSGSA